MAEESYLEKSVVEYCRNLGIYTRKMVSPSNSGVPDRIIVGKGLTLFLELKRPGETPSSLQRDEINMINFSGGFATWCADLDQAISLIDCANSCVGGVRSILRGMCDELNFWVTK